MFHPIQQPRKSGVDWNKLGVYVTIVLPAAQQQCRLHRLTTNISRRCRHNRHSRTATTLDRASAKPESLSRSGVKSFTFQQLLVELFMTQPHSVDREVRTSEGSAVSPHVRPYSGIAQQSLNRRGQRLFIFRRNQKPSIFRKPLAIPSHATRRHGHARRHRLEDYV